MTDFNGFVGRAKRLDKDDYGKLGAEIGVGEDEVRAFVEVESGGKGFAPDGRPIILNEPHVFYRNLPKAKKPRAVLEGLAYIKWGQKPYPATQKARYEWLERAMEIDEAAALAACSWGLTQVLGENFRAAGYDSVQEMVLAYMEDEEEQLRSALTFIRSMGLDDDLRAHKWETFARGYNGPGYKKNAYHTKLATAYRKWAKVPDSKKRYADLVDGAEYTSLEGDDPADLPVFEIKAIQQKLRDLRYYQVGKVDGIWGPNTTGAIAAFQAEEGLPVTGLYDAGTRERMKTAGPKPISAARASTTVEDLKAQGSTTIKDTSQTKTVAKVGFFTGLATTVVSATTEYMGHAWEQLVYLKMAFERVPGWVWGMVAIGLALFFYNQAKKTENTRVEAERLGVHNGEPDPAPSPPVTVPPDTRGA